MEVITGLDYLFLFTYYLYFVLPMLQLVLVGQENEPMKRVVHWYDDYSMMMTGMMTKRAKLANVEAGMVMTCITGMMMIGIMTGIIAGMMTGIMTGMMTGIMAGMMTGMMMTNNQAYVENLRLSGQLEVSHVPNARYILVNFYTDMG